MLKGTIIENSLADKSLLKEVQVTRTWQDGSWVLHDVLVDEARAQEAGKYLADGPWYMHFWEPDKDDFLIVFKDKTFTAKRSDSTSLADIIAYGKSIGIPEEQLDFPTDMKTSGR